MDEQCNCEHGGGCLGREGERERVVVINAYKSSRLNTASMAGVSTVHTNNGTGVERQKRRKPGRTECSIVSCVSTGAVRVHIFHHKNGSAVFSATPSRRKRQQHRFRRAGFPRCHAFYIHKFVPE